jgi:hypothetical protein
MARTYHKPFILTLIALGLAVTGWSLVGSHGALWRSHEAHMLMPELKSSLNGLTEIMVSHGETTLMLKKADEGRWVIPAFSNYPVDLGRLRGMLNELSHSTLLEKKTAREENYGRLGLQDAEATRVTLIANDQTVGDLLIGKPAERRRNATYVRFPDKPQAWVASGRLQTGSDLKQWVRQEVVNIRQDRVKEVSVEHAGGPSVRITRDTVEADFRVTPEPKEINKSVEYQLMTIPQLFTRLKLVDVMAERELRASGRDVTVMQTFDGLTLRLRFNGEGESWPEYWVTLEASTTGEASDEVKKEAEDINTRTAGWAYRFAPYLMTQLRTTPEGLMNYKGPLPVE